MDIRTFAERVLFGHKLSEKLVSPGRLTDENTGQALAMIRRPARPAGLELSSNTKKRVTFPSVAALDDPTARGRVLHFFANHELLALELMALALLRFPNAPGRFRKRLVATMKDEQKHLNLYLARMKTLGVELGTVPLNSFFWDRLSTVETPLEFVAGMSMTFEQANLDFSLFYRDAFRTVGDQFTADIMDEVLVDEIAHVRHGTHFFDQWRSPELTQWDAYRALLQYPLTPARAKGIGFTRTHRKKAGLDEDFIARLEVFSHSKGRPPKVFVFNPEFELNLAEGYAGYTPPKAIRELKRDLEMLPMFLARADDVVLVSEPVCPQFLADLKRRGYTTPEFVLYDDSRPKISASSPLSGRLIEGCEPWGWDHGIAQFLQPLAKRFRQGSEELSERVIKGVDLASKSWLAERQVDIIQSLPQQIREHCITQTLPGTISHMAALKPMLSAWRALGYTEAVVKAPLGSAGRGALKVNLHHQPDPKSLRWIERVLSQQGRVVVEPWYERLMDLSYLFRVHGDGQIDGLGQTCFITDESGRYRGTFLGAIKHVVPRELSPFFYRAGGHDKWVWQAAEHVIHALRPRLQACQFTGLAGIDLMLVRDVDGTPKLRIPLELNPRPTMGHVARRLAQPLGSSAVGLWLLISRKEIGSKGYTSFEDFLVKTRLRLSSREQAPGQSSPDIFPTTDPKRARNVCGICVTASRFEILKDVLSSTGICGDLGLLAKP